MSSAFKVNGGEWCSGDTLDCNVGHSVLICTLYGAPEKGGLHVSLNLKVATLYKSKKLRVSIFWNCRLARKKSKQEVPSSKSVQQRLTIDAINHYLWTGSYYSGTLQSGIVEKGGFQILSFAPWHKTKTLNILRFVLWGNSVSKIEILKILISHFKIRNLLLAVLHVGCYHFASIKILWLIKHFLKENLKQQTPSAFHRPNRRWEPWLWPLSGVAMLYIFTLCEVIISVTSLVIRKKHLMTWEYSLLSIM